MTQSASQLPEALADRGIGVQAVGFAFTGVACLVILKSFAGSEFWLYLWLETAALDLYWSFVVPLAALFDWGRKMFERGKAIREAKKAEIAAKARNEGIEQGTQQGIEQGTQQGIEQGTQQGIEQENQRIREMLEQHGVTLSPEVAESVFGGPSGNGS